jgi:hypothetical protein
VFVPIKGEAAQNSAIFSPYETDEVQVMVQMNTIGRSNEPQFKPEWIQLEHLVP